MQLMAKYVIIDGRDIRITDEVGMVYAIDLLTVEHIQVVMDGVTIESPPDDVHMVFAGNSFITINVQDDTLFVSIQMEQIYENGIAETEDHARRSVRGGT